MAITICRDCGYRKDHQGTREARQDAVLHMNSNGCVMVFGCEYLDAKQRGWVK